MSLESSNERKPGLFGCHGETNAKKKLFEEKFNQHKTKMDSNPFSPHYKTSSPSKLPRNDPNYGSADTSFYGLEERLIASVWTHDRVHSSKSRPVAGSKTERRGLKAAAHINREVSLLCEMIYQEGVQSEDGRAYIIFKDLFQIYTRISNKVVGTLLRGRRHGFIDFEGETLFQGRDDDVPIFLLKPIKEIRDELSADQEFEIGVCHRRND